MLRRFYNLIFPVAFLLLLPGYLRRMVRRGSYRQNFGQRLGFYNAETTHALANLKGGAWLQAVSVGEMFVALKLAAALRERAPGLPLVLSTTTTTGYTLARERAPIGVEVIYTPVDLLGSVRRTFDLLRPTQLIVVDGGLWPNQLWEARRRKVSTALVNARLSPRSEKRFRRFPRLASALFGLLDLVCVAELTDLERWPRLGVESSRLRLTGSIKYDDMSSASEATGSATLDSTGKKNAKKDLLTAWGIAPHARILLAGSTHPGEEATLAEIYIKLRTRFKDLFFVIVPRHVERTDQIKVALERLGLSVALRTTKPPAPLAAAPGALLINTTGELQDWYRLATVVFIGKSLHGVGGQNPAEAIEAGVPIIFGPHMENFSELATGLLKAKAAAQVRTAQELEESCSALLSDPEARQRLAETARRQILTHRGAANRTAILLLEQRQNSPC